MAEDTFLGDDFVRQLMNVGEVDLLVGIPSYNNAGTIGQTLQAIEESLRQGFIRDRVVILNVDGGSTDNTREVLLGMNGKRSAGSRGLTSLRTVHRVSSQYGNVPSQGMALQSVLAAADLLRARYCAVVSPAAANLSASWIANLLRPVHQEQCDFVAPLYERNRYQGLLARNLLYPMSRAVFGKRIRELYADEWAFSGRLAAQCLSRNVWHEEAVRARPEAWMGITAICGGFQCGQSFLGQKPLLVPGATPDIVEAIRQTVGGLFWSLEEQQTYWMEKKGSEKVPTFGPDHELTLDDAKPLNADKILELFRRGVTELEPVLSPILSAETHEEIKALAAREPDGFRFGIELWVKTLYEFAASYHHAVLNRDHLVQALVPLYRGRLYSFLLEHADSSPEEMEADSEVLCEEFERQKPYLVERWKAKAEVKT